MALHLIRSETMEAMADALRLRRDGIQERMTPGAMRERILKLPGGEIPAYCYAEALDVAARIRSIQQTGHEVLVFGAVTDCHVAADETYGPLSRQSVRHGIWALGLILRLVGADVAVNLGDNAWENNDSGDSFGGWHDNQNYAADASLSLEHGLKVIRIPGNHDQSETFGNAYHYIGSRNAFDSVGPTPERGYGYVDLTDQKIRFIGLNTSDYCGATGGYDLSYEQKRWFMSALDLSGKENPEQWGIVLLSHFPLDFTGASSYDSAGQIQTILDAYVNGTEAVVSVNSGYASANQDTVTADFRYDYSGKNQAQILLNAHGHLHNGASGKMEGSGIPRVCAFNTCYYLEKSDTYGTAYDEADAYGKTDGTAADTAVTFYVVDRTEQMVYAIAYGAGADRELYIGTGKRYSVTWQLSEVTAEPAVSYVDEGQALNVVLTPTDGAGLTNVVVTMGGADITSDCYASGNVGIPRVTGDVVISAVADFPAWRETIADGAVAIRSVWHMGTSPAVPELNSSNAYAAIGVTTANGYAYTDRESNTVYIMPVRSDATNVSVANSDGSGCTYRFWGLKSMGDGTMNEVCSTDGYGEGAFQWTRGAIDHLLIAAYHTDGSSWSWGYDDSQIRVTFSNT